MAFFGRTVDSALNESSRDARRHRPEFRSQPKTYRRAGRSRASGRCGSRASPTTAGSSSRSSGRGRIGRRAASSPQFFDGRAGRAGELLRRGRRRAHQGAPLPPRAGRHLVLPAAVEGQDRAARHPQELPDLRPHAGRRGGRRQDLLVRIPAGVAHGYRPLTNPCALLYIVTRDLRSCRARRVPDRLGPSGGEGALGDPERLSIAQATRTQARQARPLCPFQPLPPSSSSVLIDGRPIIGLYERRPPVDLSTDSESRLRSASRSAPAALGKRSIKKSAKQAGHPPRHLDARPDDARGQGLRGQGPAALPQGGRAPCRATRPCRTSRPSASTRTSCRSPKAALAGSGVKVASVATGFPAGLVPLPVKIEETRRAVAMGADEIDMVIDRGAFLSGDYAAVFEEIVAVKEACGAAHLKVILETGRARDLRQRAASASHLAMAAGADFIKTSTGKVSPAATPGVVLVMLEAIRDHYFETGRRVGMKPAGGDPDLEAGAPPARPRQGDARRRLADAGPVPHRRLDGHQRPPDAARQGIDRPLPERGLLHEGLGRGDMSTTVKDEGRPAGRRARERCEREKPRPRVRRRLGLRAGARGDGHRPPREALRALHRRALRAAALEEVLPDDQPGDRGGARRGRRGRAPPTSMPPCAPPRRRTASAGRSSLPAERGQVHLPHRPPDPGEVPRARGSRDR